MLFRSLSLSLFYFGPINSGCLVRFRLKSRLKVPRRWKMSKYSRSLSRRRVERGWVTRSCHRFPPAFPGLPPSSPSPTRTTTTIECFFWSGGRDSSHLNRHGESRLMSQGTGSDRQGREVGRLRRTVGTSEVVRNGGDPTGRTIVVVGGVGQRTRQGNATQVLRTLGS